MTRFYVPQPQIENRLLKVEGSEARHIRLVLRLKPGDVVTLFDGSGKEYHGMIIGLGASSVSVRIDDISLSDTESPLEITLAQSLLKGEKMDYLIQKATELGVRRIVPFSSSRSVPLLDPSKQLKRKQRWESLAVAASKQCGRSMLPKIEPLQDYAVMLSSIPRDGLRLIMSEHGGGDLRRSLEGTKEVVRVFFIVGPEGGWSRHEIELAEREGVIPITLGKRILKAETAGLCLISILQYILGDLG